MKSKKEKKPKQPKVKRIPLPKGEKSDGKTDSAKLWRIAASNTHRIESLFAAQHLHNSHEPLAVRRNAIAHSESDQKSSQSRIRSALSIELPSTQSYVNTFTQCQYEHSAVANYVCNVCVHCVQFTQKFGPFGEFASAREQHLDGDFHIHVFVAFQRRKDVQSSRAFDIHHAGAVYHPNIQKCESRANWLKYISKEGDNGVSELVAGPSFNPLGEELGKRKSLYLDYLWSVDYQTLQNLKEPSFPIELQCEGGITHQMDRPDPKLKRRNWWIVAPPNAGKTRWLNRMFAGTKVYCPREGKYPFEGYRDQDIVVYDDRAGVRFEEFASVLNTWNIIMPIAGEIRYVTQNWKMGHTRSVIVLSNKTIEESMEEGDWVRMKKRFIQIIDPKLMNAEEEEEEKEDSKEEAYAAFEVSSEYAAFAS